MGVRDRLYETGVLDDWKERVEHEVEEGWVMPDSTFPGIQIMGEPVV